MHKPLLILSMAVILFTASGCRKILGPGEDRLTGDWQLRYIERRHFLNWNEVTNQYGSGTFTFYDDGSAFYEDAIGTMNGTWRLQRVRDGYYDDEGDYQENLHDRFILRMYNFNDNRILDISFDDFRWRGRDQFKALYNTPNYTYRYDFRRR